VFDIPVDGPNASSNDAHESQPFDVELKEEYIFNFFDLLYVIIYFIKKQYNYLKNIKNIKNKLVEWYIAKSQIILHPEGVR
jgi:hypothetical protein